MPNALILFAMIPAAGKTKHRLMPFLSAEECVSLYECFTRDVYQKALSVDADIYVFFTPRDKGGVLKAMFEESTILLPQYGDDLGQKMKHAIGAVLRLGYDKVVLMGMDIPHIHTETIQNSRNRRGIRA